MRIIVAETAGFCWGVQRAIDIALDVSKSTGAPVYTYGPLIHNTQVVDELKKRNIQDLQGDVENASDGTLVIRAHGVRPDVRASIMEHHAGVIDATCPLVMKVHRKIIKHQEEGYQICIMGDAKHPEVVGLMGSARDKAIIIPPDPEIVGGMDYIDDRVCLVSQTTQNYETFEKVSMALSHKCKELLVVNTICEPTRSHQMETMDVSSRVDMVVVVGGKHSANTRHLAELAATLGPKVIHVETDGELKPSDFKDVKVVGVTAGASTPQWMIRRVVDRLKSFEGRSGILKRIFSTILEILVPTHILTIGAFASLYAGIYHLLPDGFSIRTFLSTLGVVFALHGINEFSEEAGFDRRSRLSPVVYENFRRGMLLLSVIALAVSLIFSYQGLMNRSENPFVFYSLLLASLGGVIYGWKLVPQKYIRQFGFRSIKDLPGSKDLTVSTGWTFLLAIVPWISSSSAPDWRYGLLIVLVFMLVYRRSAIMAVRDVQGDRIVGMESSFKFLGKVRSRKLHRWIDRLLVFFSLIAWVVYFRHDLLVSSMLLLSVSIGTILSHLYRRKRLPVGPTGQFLLDFQFVFPGLLGLMVGLYLK